MRDAVTLIGELDGSSSACIWEVGRDGRRLNLRAGLEDEVVGAGRRVSAARDSHAGAALDVGHPRDRPRLGRARAASRCRRCCARSAPPAASR